MATGIKICKYCGKEYPACKTVFRPGVFRWRDVACCEEHAEKYLERVLAARGINTEQHSDDPVVSAEANNSGDDAAEVAVEENDTFVATKKKSRKKFVAEEPEVEYN